jgi:hypothetical protein
MSNLHRCFLHFVGSIYMYGKLCIKFPQSWMKGERHKLMLANLAKGNMSFCHHLVSVVCHPFTKWAIFIDASYQVSVHLAKWFQRRRFLINSCAKSAWYDRRQHSYNICSSNCRRFFVCRTVNWEPLGQFTSNFAVIGIDSLTICILFGEI